jgi:hypothetical protein
MDSTRVSPSGISQDIYSIFTVYSLMYLFYLYLFYFIFSEYSWLCYSAVPLERRCLWNQAWLWLVLQHFEDVFEEPGDFHCVYVVFHYRR